MKMKNVSPTILLVDKIRKLARETLSPGRYEHTLRVAEEAVRIGYLTGEDIERCELSGILHDIAREYGPEDYAKLGLREVPGAFAPEKGEYDHVLMHGMAAAVIGRKKFGITDEEVLEAVSWHTAGRAGLSRIAQIVFVADYTEPGRVGEHFDIVRRELAEKGLMAATCMEAELSARYWLGREGIDPEEAFSGRAKAPANCRWSIETMNWARAKMED